MFNPFNFGARLTPSIPKVFVLRTSARDAARLHNALLHLQLHCSQTDCECESATKRIRFLRRNAARSAASPATRTLRMLLHRL